MTALGPRVAVCWLGVALGGCATGTPIAPSASSASASGVVRSSSSAITPQSLTTGPAEVSGSAASVPAPAASAIPWQGLERNRAEPHTATLALAGGERVTYTPAPNALSTVTEPGHAPRALDCARDDCNCHIRRERSSHDVLWDHPLRGVSDSEVSMVVEGGRLYAAHYPATSDGGKVYAIDLDSGRELWATELHGLGGVDHSKYWNRVLLVVREGVLVAFGHEAFGRYTEVLDPARGTMLSTFTLPDAH